MVLNEKNNEQNLRSKLRKKLRNKFSDGRTEKFRTDGRKIFGRKQFGRTGLYQERKKRKEKQKKRNCIREQQNFVFFKQQRFCVLETAKTLCS